MHATKEYTASRITATDGTGTRYLTDITFDASHGLPFSWRAEDALQIRRQGAATELLPRLKKAFPTLRFTEQTMTRRELR